MDIEKLTENYLSDFTGDLLDEAIATIEHFCESLSENEIYHRNRPLMVAYLALISERKKET